MKFKIVLTLFIIIIFGSLFYFMDKERQEDIDTINKNPRYINGKVIGKSSYKGRSISIRYVVNNKEYVESADCDENDKINIGDSIRIKYAYDSPDIMITQFDDSF